jgi:hypothetical protein
LGGREEDRHSYFINVSVKGIEKKTNKIVSQEGQGLFEFFFPSIFIFSLEATTRSMQEKGRVLLENMRPSKVYFDQKKSYIFA